MELTGHLALEAAALAAIAGGSPAAPEAADCPSWIHPAILAASLLIALILTPIVGRIARRFRLLDFPTNRKVHHRPIPRLGGVAIFLAFMIPFGGYLATMFFVEHADLSSVGCAGFLIGACAAFLVGLADDVHGMGPWAKLLAQCGIGALAYRVGIGIDSLDLPWIRGLEFGIFSLPVTILWFLLVINAINLIDGLDGLAAGVSFFSGTVLFITCLLNGQWLAAAGFAALAGSILGFLRYNFNPASIFMGDGGSYFIGYTLASLSIVGSMKSTASVTILIPIIAMGLPLMDVVWSTIRRFLLGQRLFQADRDHLHHRLLRLGYSHRRAVLILYGVTAALGALSLVIVHMSSRSTALILVLVGLGATFFIRKLGYVDYLTSEKMLGWFRDLTSVIGIEKGSRTFLGLQMAIAEARTLEELWEALLPAAEHLGLDSVQLDLHWSGMERPRRFVHRFGSPDPLPPEQAAQDPVMRISFPVGSQGDVLGHLQLAKSLTQVRSEAHVLRRIEHLRGNLGDVLARIRMEQLRQTAAARPAVSRIPPVLRRSVRPRAADEAADHEPESIHRD